MFEEGLGARTLEVFLPNAHISVFIVTVILFL
jgi:hypothetical protein